MRARESRSVEAIRRPGIDPAPTPELGRLQRRAPRGGSTGGSDGSRSCIGLAVELVAITAVPFGLASGRLTPILRPAA